jgi:PAS domain S-box-containing protein
LGLLGLYAISRYNFLLFHCLAEAFSIIIAIAVFAIFWNTRHLLENSAYLVIGFGCLFAGILDVVYIFGYRGMSVFPGADGNTALQAKTVAQWFVSLSCVGAFAFLRRKINQTLALSLYSGLLALALGAIFYWRVFPDCYREGVGQTLFERIGLMISYSAYLAALGLLVRNRREFDSRVFKFLAATLIVFFVEDLASAVATDINGTAKTLAHLCQVVALYFVYKAFVEVGLTQPYDLLFRSQQQSAEALEQQRQFLETVLDNVQSGILACDANGVLTLLNRSLRELHGVPPQGSPGEHGAENYKLYRPDGKTPMKAEEIPLLRALRGERIHDVEMVVVPRAGPARTCVASGEPLRGKDGLIRGAVVSVHDITERKRMEEALAAAASEWSATFDAMADGVSVHGPDYTISNVNRSLCQMLGRTKQELIGSKCYQVFHGTNAPIAGCPIEKSTRTFCQEGAELFEPTLNRWLAASASPILDEAGHVTRLVHTVRDITDRKRAEEALRQSEEGLRLVLEASGTGWWRLDLAGGNLTTDDRCKALFGLPPATEPSMALFRERISSADWQVAEQHVAEAMVRPGDCQAEYRTLWPDGSLHWIFIKGRSFQDAPGKPRRLEGILMDITDRKRAEEALRASEERHRLLVETIPQLAWRVSPDGMDVECNRRWYEYTGQSPAQVGAHGWLAPIHPDDLFRVVEQATHAANTKEPYEAEYRLRRASDGSYRWQLGRAVPVLGGDGEVICWIGCTTDIEELKQAQEILKKAHDEQLQRHRTELAHVARLSMMGEMAASLAHEINQPLSAINSYARGCVRRVLKKPEKDTELVAALEQVSEEAIRAAEIIRRVRGFVQKHEPQFSEVLVNDLVEEVVLLSKAELEQRHAQAVIELSENLPVVLGDPVQIEQVIMNLVRNGLEAMDKTSGGDRILRIKTMRHGDEMVQVEVCDGGMGIGEEHLEKVFEPFFTTKPEGMGMGLAISRSIVQTHGGNLWASLNQDRGCTFHFTLPVGKRS